MWWYFISNLENVLLTAVLMAEQIPPASPERL